MGMKGAVKKFLVIGLFLAIGLFIIRCLITKPTGLYDAFGHMGQVVSITLVFMGLYERIFWRYNPFDKTPLIYGAYSGTIEYEHKGKRGKKNTNIVIKQSLLSVSVKITTNETISYTITSNLIEENGEYVLYYTYITNPKSKFSDENPMHFGTCRLDLSNTTDLHGIYWNSQSNKGDISLKRSVKPCPPTQPKPPSKP